MKVGIFKRKKVDDYSIAFMAVVSAVLGYFITDRVWSWWVGKKWRRRLAIRRCRAALRAREAGIGD